MPVDLKNFLLLGVVTETLPNAAYRIKIGDNRIVTAFNSGKLRMNFILPRVGDEVLVRISPRDESTGRIEQITRKKD